MPLQSHSAAGTPRFEYVDDISQFDASQARTVRIGRGIRAKRALLAIYAESLPLPDYFGWNWDALEECLRDLLGLALPGDCVPGDCVPGECVPSDAAAKRPLVIIHEAIPLRNGSIDRQTYLQLLDDLAENATNDGSGLQVVFPSSARAKIATSLAMSRGG